MSTRRPPLQDFAIEVTGKLASIVNCLSQRQDTQQFCTTLHGELWLISNQLKVEETVTSDLRLSKLLNNLERLCKPSSRRYLSRPSEKSVDLIYPGLTQLRLDNRKPALELVRKLACDRSPEGTERRRNLIRILQGFSSSLTPRADLPQPKLDREVSSQDDFSSSIRELYDTLSSYCICNAGGEKKPIVVKLRLAIGRMDEDHNPEFGVMFLAHPHDGRNATVWWRDTRIRVDLKTVRFEKKSDKYVRLMAADFCERISRGDHFQLSLIASNKELQFKEFCKGANTWIPTSRSVTLTKILGDHKLSNKMKYLLSYLLAKSVWQFYNTAWMGKEWTKENVQFMFERRCDLPTGIYLNEPFISARFDPIEPWDNLTFLPHKFPKIRALGIMLLEIELGTVIENYFTPECFGANGEVNADADLYTALELYDHSRELDDEKLDDTPTPLKTVIGECLRPEKFMMHRNNIEGVREALQDHVVNPLYTLVKEMYGHPDKVALRPTVEASSSSVLQRANRAPITPNGVFPESPSHLRATTPIRLNNYQLCSDWCSDIQSRSAMRPTSRGDFEIAVVCALPLEADAVDALFDHHWDEDGPPYDKLTNDSNAYSTGAIGRHNVVLAHMPGMGKSNAAAVAANCCASFPNIKLALVVGICGGVPFTPDDKEILLGDVVISDGVVQYDLGRRLPDRFVQKDRLLDALGRPNAEVRALLAKLRGLRKRKVIQVEMAKHLDMLRQEPELGSEYPGATYDKLFEASYRHKHRDSSCATCTACQRRTDRVCHIAVNSSCEELGCDDGRLVPRQRLVAARSSPRAPSVHFGLIASGDTVLKSGEDRDEIARTERVIAFEMEGAGVWDSSPCVVIKGVCDYADSHKNKKWQRYAAATAAACMKAVLDHWVPSLPAKHQPFK